MSERRLACPECREPSPAGEMCSACLRRLPRTLGMPRGAGGVHVLWPGPRLPGRWDDYTLSLVGREQRRIRTSPWPFIEITLNDGHVGTIQLWRQRVHHRESPVFLEALWHPRRGFTLALRGLEATRRLDEIRPLERALQLIVHPVQKGRPLGLLSLPDFPDRLRAALARWQEKHDDVPTQADMAEELHLSLASLKRHLARFGLRLRRGHLSRR